MDGFPLRDREEYYFPARIDQPEVGVSFRHYLTKYLRM